MFAFMSKEHYLEYRKNWKKRYKELSEEIKDLKYQRYQYQTTYNKITLQDPTLRYYTNKLNTELEFHLFNNIKYHSINLKYKSKFSHEKLLERQAEARHMNESLVLAKEKNKCLN